MKLFSYEDIGSLAKYSKEIFYGCLIVTGIVAIAALIFSFTRERIIGKIFCLILSVAIVCGLLWCSDYLKGRTEEIYSMYITYNEAYENGDVKIIKGQIKDFTPATESKSFTLDGVDFKIYPAGVAKPTEGTKVVLYYTYYEAVSNTLPNSGSPTGYVQSYSPERCVILGDNQWLEIHYIVEDGENRILYIGEIEPQ